VKIAQTSAGPPSLTISDLSRFLPHTTKCQPPALRAWVADRAAVARLESDDPAAASGTTHHPLPKLLQLHGLFTHKSQPVKSLRTVSPRSSQCHRGPQRCGGPGLPVSGKPCGVAQVWKPPLSIAHPAFLSGLDVLGRMRDSDAR
jgi:hypothetical protein